MKRRILCFVLTMAMVLSMLVVVPATIASADSYDVSISTAAEFKAFRDAVNDGTYDSGVTAQLTADVDISDANWTPIGNSTSHPFKGTFNGNGHTISGLIQTRGTTALSSSNAGLFGYVSSVDGGTTTITNFKLTSSGTGITGYGSGGNVDVGTVVSQVRGSTTGIVTVNVTGVWSTVNLDASSQKAAGVGGIVGVIGWVSDAQETILNVDSCRYSGTLGSPSAGSNDYGGIVGWTRENNTPKSFYITNCLFDGVLSLYHNSPDDNGGIIGYLKGNSGSSKVIAHIENCIVAGQFQHPNKSGYAVTGYVLSEASGSNTDYQVTNVYYCNDADRHTGGDLGGWYGYYKKGDGAISSLITYSNVTAKTMTELKAMTAGSNFADDTKWHFGESSELPVPAMIYDNIISNVAPSIFDDMTQSEFTITTDEEMAEFQALVNAGTTFAGKTIKLGADVALNGRIGATSSLAFSGSFDGQGHTVTITQSISNPDGNGGLFDFVRIPENGTITIQNVHVTGTITLTNSTTGKGYTGGLISSVDANTSGNGGTINIQNVWNTVRINGGNSNAWNSLGGFIGFVRHADGLKQITINIDSCLWDGVINSGPAIYHAGGFIGYTGNNKAGRQPTINITNSVAAGTIMANIDGWNQQFGVLTSYLKGSYSDDATAKVTVNIENVISLAKATFAKATGSGSTIGLIEQVDGTTELNLSNLYYKTFERTGVEGDFPVVAEGAATTSTNVVAKTQAELLTMSTSVFSDPTKWVDQSDEHYPCPAGIVNVFGSVPNTLYVEGTDVYIGTDEAMASFASAVSGGKTYAGKTVHLSADVNLTTTVGSTSSYPFSGNFNGHGHTVTISQTLADPDGNGGLFSFVRIPENSTLTIQNVHLAGTITLTNNATGKGYCGALISSVDAGTTGSSGTINITNVWNTVRINAGASNAWYGVSAFIGFVRHAAGLKPLTINMDSCLWDGILNFGPATEYCGSFVGYTGNGGNANRPLTLNITNSVVAGTMMLNTSYSDDSGLLTGYLKGNGNNSATSAVTANFHDIVVTGKITSSVDLTESKWNSSLFEVSGTTTVDMANLYYIPRSVRNKTLTVYEDSSSDPATVKPTGTATEKTSAEMYALSTSAFSDASKWSKQNSYYVCPTGIVETFGEIPASLLVDVYEISDEIEIGTVAEFIAFRDKVNSGSGLAGKTITLTADIDLDVAGLNGENEWVEIGRGASNAFRGVFDGDGHTVNFVSDQKWTSGYIDTQAGLFGHLNGATVKNLVLTGSMTLHNNAPTSAGETDYIGSVAGAVTGTTLIQNVKSSVNITTKTSKNTESGTWPQGIGYVGGLVGFIPHNNTADITIDACVYSGTINAANQAKGYSGIMAFTGNGGTKTVTIQNCAFTGRMTLNENYAYAFQGVAGIFGHVKSGTVTITGTHSAGNIYFNRTKAWPAADGDGNPVKAGQIVGYIEQSEGVDTATVVIDNTVTYVPAYYYTALPTSVENKYVLPEIGRINGVYGGNGGDNSEAVIGGMEASFEARNVEDTYKGIRFKATFYTTALCQGGGTSSANFGIYLLTMDTYTILGGESVTKAQLDAAGSTVVQVKATKYQNNTSSYVVNAVVYNLNTAARQATEFVAIPYAGDTLGNVASTTYNALFN